MQYGEYLEKKVIAKLIELGCTIHQDINQDRFQQVDFAITAIGDDELPFPVEVQLTLRGGSRIKLEKYLRSSNRTPDKAHIYGVMPHRASPFHTAKQLVRFIKKKFLSEESSPKIVGVFFSKRRKYQEFDPYERLVLLMDREDPVKSAHRRLTGHITKILPGQFIITTSGTSPDEENEDWIAYYGDISEEPLLFFMNDLRKRRYENPPFKVKVSFVAHRERKGLRALSVINDR